MLTDYQVTVPWRDRYPTETILNCLVTSNGYFIVPKLPANGTAIIFTTTKLKDAVQNGIVKGYPFLSLLCTVFVAQDMLLRTQALELDELILNMKNDLYKLPRNIQKIVCHYNNYLKCRIF